MSDQPSPPALLDQAVGGVAQESQASQRAADSALHSVASQAHISRNVLES